MPRTQPIRRVRGARWPFATSALRFRGLTLIEVLAVIGVIALLLGVLLPVLSHAGEAGRSANCKSNLRQLAVAAQLYAQTYKVYPPAVRYDNTGGVFRTIAWDYEHAGNDVKPGAIWQFMSTDGGKVHQCPSFHGPSTFGGDPHTGYNYNTTYIGGEMKFPLTDWKKMRWGIPVAMHRHPATTAVFGEGGWKNGANKFMRAPSNAVEHNINAVYSGGQAFRHRKATNVSYLDGHVDSVTGPKQGPHATPSLLTAFMNYPENGFLSEDDSAYDPR